MKTILLALSLCIISSFSHGQTVAAVNINKAVKPGNTLTAEEIAIIKKDHTEKAITQLNEHFSKNINYSEVMEEYLIEGKAVVEIKLSNTGRIQEASIIQSNSQLLDKSIQKAIASFKAVKVKGKIYRGNKRFQYPIQFSIDK